MSDDNVKFDSLEKIIEILEMPAKDAEEKTRITRRRTLTLLGATVLSVAAGGFFAARSVSRRRKITTYKESIAAIARNPSSALLDVDIGNAAIDYLAQDALDVYAFDTKDPQVIFGFTSEGKRMRASLSFPEPANTIQLLCEIAPRHKEIIPLIQTYADALTQSVQARTFVAGELLDLWVTPLFVAYDTLEKQAGIRSTAYLQAIMRVCDWLTDEQLLQKRDSATFIPFQRQNALFKDNGILVHGDIRSGLVLHAGVRAAQILDDNRQIIYSSALTSFVDSLNRLVVRGKVHDYVDISADSVAQGKPVALATAQLADLYLQMSITTNDPVYRAKANNLVDVLMSDDIRVYFSEGSSDSYTQAKTLLLAKQLKRPDADTRVLVQSLLRNIAIRTATVETYEKRKKDTPWLLESVCLPSPQAELCAVNLCEADAALIKALRYTN